MVCVHQEKWKKTFHLCDWRILKFWTATVPEQLLLLSRKHRASGWLSCLSTGIHSPILCLLKVPNGSLCWSQILPFSTPAGDSRSRHCTPGCHTMGWLLCKDHSVLRAVVKHSMALSDLCDHISVLNPPRLIYICCLYAGLLLEWSMYVLRILQTLGFPFAFL